MASKDKQSLFKKIQKSSYHNNYNNNEKIIQKPINDNDEYRFDDESIDLNSILNDNQNIVSKQLPSSFNNQSEKILINEGADVKNKNNNFGVFSNFKKFVRRFDDITDDGVETYDDQIVFNLNTDLITNDFSEDCIGDEVNIEHDNKYFGKFKKFVRRFDDITDDGAEIYTKPVQSIDNHDDNINAFEDEFTNQNNYLNNSNHLQSQNMGDSINLRDDDYSNQIEGIGDGINTVDSILSEIIPDYNEQISVELKKVNLTFDVVEDKIDTIKESFIRTLEGNKGKKFKVNALRDVSFKIYQGEKVGIIGYNGAGKSTLLNVIAGIFPPDDGEVMTYGTISPLLSLGAGFDMNYSGRNNILLNGAILGYDKKFLMDKMDEIIEFSELGKFIDMPIKNYSAGMLAKLGFSIATAVEPDILIIDEILGVGDVNFAKKSRDKIRSMMDGGTTVLLVSHSIPQIRELCDKAIWVDNGYIKEIGEVNKVCDNYIKDSEKANNKQLENITFR